MLKVVTEGEFKIRKGKTQDTEYFKETFDIDEAPYSNKNEDEVIGIIRSVIQGSLINDRLRKKHKNYIGFRTCAVVSISNDGNGTLSDEEKELQKLLGEAMELGVSLNLLPDKKTNEEKKQYLKGRIKTFKTKKAKIDAENEKK